YWEEIHVGIIFKDENLHYISALHRCILIYAYILFRLGWSDRTYKYSRIFFVECRCGDEV
ncbi:MAG: hypothetical protein QW810_08060, partial [Nitrososphaerota archaeon]